MATTATTATTRRTPWVRLDKVKVKARKKKGYDVVIRGFNLRGGPVVPRVTVGGVPMEITGFGRDGREIRGRLRRRPRSGVTIVDYGFARDELRTYRRKKKLSAKAR